MIASLKDLTPEESSAVSEAPSRVQSMFEGPLNRAKADGQLHGNNLDESECEIKLTLFQDGFLLGGNEFHKYDDSESQSYLHMINRGLVPNELVASLGNKSPVLTIVNKSKEVFNPSQHIHFVGEGQQLEEAKAKAVEPVNAEAATIVVDESLPKVQIQLRFHNGQKTSITVNTSHTLKQIYEYVGKAAPVDGNFNLLSGFPPAALTDMDKTVEELGLQGSAVTQKLI
ncbi:unnamed protein product [Blepharisma stoltei]|uniref:UBX domain-containing protein n=1 Tax=Blepharisma stoltei TaxID=1481888 RepID=A0AAU9J8K2_9CILI|nr:unnamed protein product [Blepharisma stoltei]